MMNMVYAFQVTVVGKIKLNLMKSKILMGLVLCYASLSWSDSYHGRDHDRAKNLLDRGNILPLQSILDKAYKLYPGKILEVELETEDHMLVYELELLLDNGHVVELLFDATTGQHISTEKED